MSELFVKICGITKPEDAGLAVELGASAVGFIFWPGSARYISPEAARSIAQGVPAGVMKVGVFVDEKVEDVARMMERAGLDAAQLHGGESPEYCEALGRLLGLDARENRWLIKAIGVDGSSLPEAGHHVRTTVARFNPEVMILLDAHDPVQHGGTGQTIDWESARKIASMRPTILAGGLTPDNVGRALSTVRPYGVDVSSGVESSLGVKDHTRMRRLFEALNG
jgi:phosphoribosylanthranilate isomerase